jgi:hypothetical protein
MSGRPCFGERVTIHDPATGRQHDGVIIACDGEDRAVIVVPRGAMEYTTFHQVPAEGTGWKAAGLPYYTRRVFNAPRPRPTPAP